MNCGDCGLVGQNVFGACALAVSSVYCGGTPCTRFTDARRNILRGHPLPGGLFFFAFSLWRYCGAIREQSVVRECAASDACVMQALICQVVSV